MALAEHIPCLSVQKQAAVLLAIVGVQKAGDDVLATVEGVMRINGSEAEVAAKIGVFYQLALNCSKIGTVETDEPEVGTRRVAASGAGEARRSLRCVGRADAWGHILAQARALRRVVHAAEQGAAPCVRQWAGSWKRACGARVVGGL